MDKNNNHYSDNHRHRFAVSNNETDFKMRLFHSHSDSSRLQYHHCRVFTGLTSAVVHAGYFTHYLERINGFQT